MTSGISNMVTAALVWGVLSNSALAGNLIYGDRLEKQAREDQAEKLIKLGEHPDMLEATSQGIDKAGPGMIDADSGNSSIALATLHSYVRSVCVQWISPEQCAKYLPPGISPHAPNPDKSPTEALTGALHEEKGTNEVQAAGGKVFYSVYEIDKPTGGSVLDEQGAFKYDGITDMKLQQDAKQQFEALGVENAEKTLDTTFGNAANRDVENDLANLESLRYMAGRWTKMLRNRLVSQLGQYRSGRKPIEFFKGEDVPDDNSYVQAVQNPEQSVQTEERLKMQRPLDPETSSRTLEQRMQLAMAMSDASVNMVNPQVEGQQIVEGDAQTEIAPERLIRANIMAIDHVGMDVSKVVPGLTQQHMDSIVGDYAVGGRQLNWLQGTNAETLQGYNNELERAAVAMDDVVARAPHIINTGDQARAAKIAIGSTDAVSLNGLTHEMKGELKDTTIAMTDRQTSEMGPREGLETAPSQLVVKNLK